MTVRLPGECEINRYFFLFLHDPFRRISYKNLLHRSTFIRGGSKISTDRFPKLALKVQASRVSGKRLAQEIFWILTPRSLPFWDSLSHSDRILARLGVTLTSKGKREFVPRDEVSLCLSSTVHNFYT